MTERTLAQIETALETAQRQLLDAVEQSRVARAREVNLVNMVNDLQKEFTAKVQEIQKKAPVGTDWKRGGTVSFGANER